MWFFRLSTFNDEQLDCFQDFMSFYINHLLPWQPGKTEFVVFVYFCPPHPHPHLTHNRGLPCTDDLARRQMLLLNSRLSPPSPHVLLQVVQDRLFETAATAKVMLLLVVLLLQLLLPQQLQLLLLMCFFMLFTTARLKQQPQLTNGLLSASISALQPLLSSLAVFNGFNGNSQNLPQNISFHFSFCSNKV